MTSAQHLEQIFGVSFLEQPDITALRQFHANANNAFCTDEEGQIVGICACENTWERLSISRTLSRLQYLNLSDNKSLKMLDFEGTLPGLKHLDLSDCAIEELKLPAGFECLEWLDASRNRLKLFIPSGQFEKLKHLDLSGNQLSDFATNLLSKFPALERLYLRENNLPDTKINSVNKPGNCLDFMQRFWRELQNGETTNNEYKVLLVGNGGVGKTCLVERLVYDSFEKKHLSTHGIALEQYKNEIFPYVLNLWDFGGQDIYHTTHRLFLQSNAIYLALWDEQTRNNPVTIIKEAGQDREYENYSLHYWLHYIKHQGKNSPVIVVKTKSEEDDSLYPQQDELRAKYDPSAFTLIDSKIDNWSDNGFNHLLFLIKEAIVKLGQEQELPQSWADLRQHLRELFKTGNKVISIDEYLDIANEDYRIEKPMEVLTDWLVTSGVVFYRQGYFDDAIILDQGWAIKAIYSIFNRNEGHYYRIKDGEQGTFTGRDLAGIWKSQQYSQAEQELLVNFMLGCELCFEMKSGKEQTIPFEDRQFFAPQLMPDKRSSSAEVFLEMAQDKPLLYVRYAHDFLHYGVIQSFIVRTQSLADVRDVWRYGILLKEGNAYALVEAVEKTILVITSEENLELLEKIRNTLEELQGEQVTEWVSLNGEDFVSLDKLKGWKEESIPALNKQLVPVKDLAVFTEKKSQERFSLADTRKPADPFLQEMAKEQLLKKSNKPSDIKLEFDQQPATILFLQANPTLEPISWQNEYTFIDEKIDKELFKLKQKKSVSRDEMIDEIEDHEPQIIHFCGHGRERKIQADGSVEQEGGIVFHNESKTKGDILDAREMEKLFAALKEAFPGISMVFLNACHSQEQALAISKAGVYTLGTTDEITSEAARLFSAGFYRSLGKTNDLFVAIKRGISRATTRADSDIQNLIHLYYNGERLFP